MKWKRLEVTVFLLLVVLMGYSAGVAVWQGELSEDVVRFRVVADADDFASQSQKLLVRDAVLAYCAEQLPAEADADELEAVLQTHLDEIAALAQQTTGNQLPVLVRLSNGWYPTRTYRNFSLPAGRYTGLQIHLGAAQGKNWWCVLYPSLCVDLPQEQTEQPILAFKSMEWISAICQKIWS